MLVLIILSNLIYTFSFQKDCVQLCGILCTVLKLLSQVFHQPLQGCSNSDQLPRVCQLFLAWSQTEYYLDLFAIKQGSLKGMNVIITTTFDYKQHLRLQLHFTYLVAIISTIVVLGSNNFVIFKMLTIYESPDITITFNSQRYQHHCYVYVLEHQCRFTFK